MDETDEIVNVARIVDDLKMLDTILRFGLLYI